MKTICFTGFGNMASSIAQGLRQHGDYRIIATSPSLKPEINAEGIQTHHDNLAHLHEADVIILAVKPAKAVSVLQEISPKIPPHAVLVSIAAGISLATLKHECRPEQAIVRCMPNLPIAVGKGATPLMANPHVKAPQKLLVEQMFQCSGITTWIKNENDMNAWTALSGSGPAYLFLIMEAMAEAAVKLGLPAEEARAFTLQTVAGAAALAESSGMDPALLRKKVTSPAGTTAAAIAILQKHGLNNLLYDAMQAACNRAIELDN